MCSIDTVLKAVQWQVVRRKAELPPLPSAGSHGEAWRHEACLRLRSPGRVHRRAFSGARPAQDLLQSVIALVARVFEHAIPSSRLSG